MNKYLLDCDSFRLMKTHSVTEGGMSRNLTIRNYLVGAMGYKPIEISGNSTLSAFQAICFFLMHRNDQIFIMYPTRFFLMGGLNKANRWIGNMAVKAFMRAARKNRVIMDVSDIKYEQFIDLEIPCPDLNLIERRERSIFESPIKFVFASSSMRNYAIQKYRIDEERCDVCINGGRVQDENLCPESETIINDIYDQYINCVYAGTLNKGRMIDKMLDCFSNLPTARLYLMGPMGEWIVEYIRKNNIQNVYYLGAKDEKVAHQIVSKCDLGLIPYDETRLYYNIAYPTKLSFYLTAGIPYLATPVKEVKMLEGQGFGYIGSVNEWSSIISSHSKDELLVLKRKVNEKNQEFTWNTLLEKCKMMNI